MTKLLLTILLSLAISPTIFAQETIYTIKNKRTQETIKAVCLKFDVDKCEEISLEYSNPKTGEINNFALLNSEQVEQGDNFVDEVAFSMESEQLHRNKYKIFGAFRKVCDMGSKRLRDNSICIVKFLVGTLAVVAGGLGPEGPGFVLELALKTGLATTLGFSAAFRDFYFVQMALFYPALAVDILRFVTVLPVKKIINAIKTKRLKKKIIPLLEDLSYEMTNYIKDSHELDEVFSNDIIQTDRIIKNRDFKKILKAMSLLKISNDEKNLKSIKL